MYFLSIISVIIATGIICLTSMGVGGNYIVWRIFDVPTIIMFLLLFIPLLASSGLWKDFNNAFRIGIGKKKTENLLELKRAGEAVGLSIKITGAAAMFIVAIQFIQILYNLEDPYLLGPSFVVLTLAVLYGMGLIMILLPLKSILNVKIQEYISGQE